MKRKIALLLAALMTMSLVACGNNQNTQEPASGGAPSSTPSGSGGGATSRNWPSDVVIVSGTTGGTSYYIGAAQAQILTEKIEGVSFVTEATNASIMQNGPLVNDDPSIIGHFVIPALLQAREGTYPNLDATYDSIYLIQVGNSTRPQFITLAENGINDISDLRNKRIAVPPVTTVVYTAAMQILEAYGLTESDFAALTPMAFTDQGDALKDGTIDCAIVAGGFPQAVASDLNSSRDIVMLSISDEAMAKILAVESSYMAEIVPAGTYSDVTTDVQVLAIPQSIGCNIAMDEDLVYEITKALNESTEELTAVHAEGADWNLEKSLTVYQAGVVPFHPGAARYYDEILAGK